MKAAKVATVVIRIVLIVLLLGIVSVVLLLNINRVKGRLTVTVDGKPYAVEDLRI